MISCSFYIRMAVDGGYRYEPVSIASPQGDGALRTEHAPAIGDRIHLWDSTRNSGGEYVVLARSWLHSSYGSTNWPYAERNPHTGPRLDIIVEPASGVFEDEVSDGDDAESDQR